MRDATPSETGTSPGQPAPEPTISPDMMDLQPAPLAQAFTDAAGEPPPTGMIADISRTSFVAFMAERTAPASAGARQYVRKNLQQNSKKVQKLIKYHSADERIRSKLDASRLTEWQKWQRFNAGIPIA